MKNLKIYAILGLSALLVLSACKKDELTEDESPVLSLSETALTVSAEGGTVSVYYQVETPVDGSTVSVDLGEVSWITDADVTESTIDLTVEANSGSESRTATLTVSYPGAQDVSLTVTQEAYGYDYNHTLEDFVGYIYEDYGYNYENLFHIWLSDIGFDESGSTQAGGHYYEFYLFADVDDISSLPTGTYSYSTGSEDRTFYAYSSYYYEDTSIYLSGGSITVSADGDDYTIEGVVTDENGATHHVYYNGPAAVKNSTLDEDLEFTATTAVASFYLLSGNIMNVDLMFTDMEYDGTYVYPPGTYVVLDTYIPYDADGKIAAGTYDVTDTGNRCTIYPYYYSYVYNYETTSDYTFGRIMSGTMTVEAGSQEDYYTISCEFKTETDATVKCTYTGYLVVDDVPVGDSDFYSTLTEDLTLDLNGAIPEIYVYGDYWETGGNNLYVMFFPEGYGAGDVLFIDINATADAVVPEGSYTASTTDTPAIGEFVYGYAYDEDYNAGSWYYEYDEFWDSVNKAPLAGGTITFTNNNDGTYTMTVDCKDDLGYSISGTWTGSFDTISYYSASTSSAKRPAAKSGKQEISARTAGMKTAKEIKVKSVSPAGAVSKLSLKK